MYVCMHVCFCHLHWCAPATAVHSCRLWGPTTSLTHPLHTPHTYIKKINFTNTNAFYVMYVCISPPAEATSRSEGEKTVSFTDPACAISNPRTSNRFTHLFQVTARRNVFQCIHSFIHTVLLLTLYCIMFCTILSLAEFFPRPFSLHWPSLS
jgi:hypothetical protein